MYIRLSVTCSVCCMRSSLYAYPSVCYLFSLLHVQLFYVYPSVCYLFSLLHVQLFYVYPSLCYLFSLLHEQLFVCVSVSLLPTQFVACTALCMCIRLSVTYSVCCMRSSLYVCPSLCYLFSLLHTQLLVCVSVSLLPTQVVACEVPYMHIRQSVTYSVCSMRSSLCAYLSVHLFPTHLEPLVRVVLSNRRKRRVDDLCILPDGGDVVGCNKKEKAE
jgi:hypothetical protein